VQRLAQMQLYSVSTKHFSFAIACFSEAVSVEKQNISRNELSSQFFKIDIFFDTRINPSESSSCVVVSPVRCEAGDCDRHLSN
jgi:hypothetical protein